MRPALILTAADGTERRLLAELDDTPWAAQDGEPWQAAFLLDGDLDAATALELSVAPDITVPLRDGGEPVLRRSRRERGPVPATAPATPRTQMPPPARRPASRVQDTERLTTRLSAVEAALERERARRAEAESALEQQRGEARRLSAELGRAQADLELSRTAEREAADTAALLDATRRDNHEARARYEALATEHDRALRSEAQLEDDLRRSDIDLAQARTQLATARDQLGELTQHAEQVEARGSDRHEAHVEETTVHGAAVAPGHPRHSVPPHSDRPVNPSLRHHSWFVRFLVLLVIAALALAVYFVLHSTVLGP